MKKLTAPLTAVLCLLAVLTLGLFAIPNDALAAKEAKDAEDTAAEIGTEAPGFTLPNVVNEDEVSLSDFEDRVVVLMFHSITCPFYAMHEEKGYDRVFVPMVEAYKEKNIVFLGINANRTQSIEQIQKYIEKHEINYTVLKDEGNKIADAYGAKVTPHIMVIDREGKLRYRGGVEELSGGPANCGKSDTQYLGPVIDALLEDEDPPYTETKASGCGIQRVK